MDSSMRSLRSISADGSPSSLKQIKQVTQVGSYNLWMYYANYSRISQRKGIEMDWLLSILGSADVPRVSWDPTTPHSPLTFLIQSLGNISSAENGKKTIPSILRFAFDLTDRLQHIFSTSHALQPAQHIKPKNCIRYQEFATKRVRNDFT